MRLFVANPLRTPDKSFKFLTGTALVLLIGRGSKCHLGAKRQSVNTVRIRLRTGEYGWEYPLLHLITTKCKLRSNSSVSSRSAQRHQSRYTRFPRPKVLFYTGDVRAWRSAQFCMGRLRADQLLVAGKAVEDVTRTSCKRVAADAKNPKGQKSGGVSHHGRPHGAARRNLLNSNAILHLATSFPFEAVSTFSLRCWLRQAQTTPSLAPRPGAPS